MIYGFIALIIGFALLHYLLQQKKEAPRVDFSLEEQEEMRKLDAWRQRKQEDRVELEKNFEEYESLMKESLHQMEKIIQEKESRVEQRAQRNESIQAQELQLVKELESLWANVQSLEKKEWDFYIEKTGANPEVLKERLMRDLEELILSNKEMRQDAILQEYQEDVPKHAQSALQLAMQRLSVPSSVDKNHTVVAVRYDAFKGMLAGKEGKNVRYLESKLPVFVVFNQPDTESIYVGGLNLFRRHIAKKTIEKLQFMTKGQGIITHAMIDEAIESAEKEMMQLCDKKGAWACEKMGIDPSRIPPILLNYMGRLNYRTSYGQNIIYHSLEMAFAARMLAEMIGSDPELAMLGAFYHDIGKAIDHDIGGSHDDISKDILQIHGFSDELIRAVYCHHDKVECEAPADYLVKAVDAISGGRPGARMESVFNYFDRIKQLEEAALQVEGIQKVFTVSAGREVRAMVDREKVKDEAMQEMADTIAKNISEGVAFPGIIKVNVIRKTKAVDYAKEQKTR